MHQITIHFHDPLSIKGQKRLILSLEKTISVEELIQKLLINKADIGFICRSNQILSWEQMVTNGDELMIFPPLEGG